MDKTSLALDFLSTQAVQLNPDSPYLYASGLRGPIYCDNRLLMSYPIIRRRFTRALRELSGKIPFQLIGATATAGIPHGAWLAESLNLPLIYVRGASKRHGSGKRVEGAFRSNDRVLLIEDLVTTGMSSLSAVEALRLEGLRVDTVISLFQYGLPGVNERFNEAGLKLYSVLTLDELLDEASKIDTLSTSQVSTVKAWQKNPVQWNDRFVSGIQR